MALITDTTSNAGMDLLVAALRHALGYPSGDVNGTPEAHAEAFILAERNKLLVEYAQALADWGWAPSVELLEALARYRAKAQRKSRLARQSLVAVKAVLDKAGIGWIAYKGGVAQFQLGLKPDHRPANDLDILVRRADFDRAICTLAESGFGYSAQYTTSWWRDWLGEVPMSPPERNGLTIDLHHKLQQPGCPSPRNTRIWVDSRVMIDFDGLSVPAANPVAMALLCAINVVKALVHHEFCGSHAVDLARIWLREDRDFHQDLVQLASQQGLTETLALACQAVSLLTGIPLGSKDSRLASELNWARLILAPSKLSPAHPKHRAWLWALSEGKSVPRFGRFFRDGFIMIASDLVRKQLADRSA